MTIQIRTTGDSGCRALSGEKVSITPKGFVYPCVAFKSLKFPCEFNNIKKHSLKSILSTWQGFLRIWFPKEFFNKSTCNKCVAQEILKKLREGKK